MRRRRVSLATPSPHERRRQLMNDYQHKSRQTVKMSLNKCGFELLVANLTFCIMSKMVRVHFPWPRQLQAFPEFFALCMAWIAAQASLRASPSCCERQTHFHAAISGRRFSPSEDRNASAVRRLGPSEEREIS